MFEVEQSIAQAQEKFNEMARYVRQEVPSHFVQQPALGRVGRMTYDEATAELKRLFGFTLRKESLLEMAATVAAVYTTAAQAGTAADVVREVADKRWMRYDEYLAAGHPIGSGAAEGACCHLVKDRMERSGMRWSLRGPRPS